MSKKVLSDLDFTSVARITGATGFAATATTGAATLTASAASLTLTATGASSDLACSAGRNLTASATGTAAVTGGTGVTVTATTGNLALVATAAALNCTAGSSINLTHASGSFVSITGTSGSFLKFVNEAAASTPSMSAGQALFWVRNDTPNNPYFTDDTNTDRKLATAPVPNADLATMADGTLNGRALGAGSGARTDLTPTQSAAIVASGLTPTQAVPIVASAGPFKKEVFADFAVNVPAVLVGLGFVDVSTVGTVLSKLAIGDNVNVLPLADAPPCSYRVSAIDTVRLGYQAVTTAIAAAPYRIYKPATGFVPSDLSTANGGPISAWLRNTTLSGAVSSITDLLNANPAVSIAGQQPTGNADGSLTFDGTDDNFTVPLIAAINGATQWGWVGWLKPSSLVGGRHIVCIDSGGGGGASAGKISIEVDSSFFYIYVYSAAGLLRKATIAIGSAFTVNVASLYTVELDLGSGGSEASRCVFTRDGVIQTMTFADVIGSPGAMPTSTRTPTGSMNMRTHSTFATILPWGGTTGKNEYWLASGMAGRTEGLLTAAARAALKTYEPLT